MTAEFADLPSRDGGGAGEPMGPGLLASYRLTDGVYDELLDPSGAVRPHWRDLIGAMAAMTPNDMHRAREATQHLIAENGITYNVYGDPQGLERPWDLDTVPLMISSQEWRWLEKGLVQRARIMNGLLADLYGPQRLLMDGTVPAAIVFGNPEFARACHGLPVRDGLYLHLYAVDLARGPDGQWWVLGDRAQAPSGMGYALENRVILSRALPGPFQACHVYRLAAFFERLRETLHGMARRESPHIVLMTPGPLNETYFEHAYLARYLGYTLVEGADLTVRDDTVYLKTIEGLQRVDVILRRVDTDWCDPMQLRPDSRLGVPGLVQAVKAGTVVVANALGSGLVESPGLMPFVPGLARRLLGEDLQIPCVATWWCGQSQARSHVRDNLENLVLTPAFPSRTEASGRLDPTLGRALSEEAREAVLARLARGGYEVVGQEDVALSTAPVWLDGSLRSRPMALRVYIAAHGDDYIVMPGGLVRYSYRNVARAVSMQRGDGSMDAWVISDLPVSYQTRVSMPGGVTVPIQRGGAALSSRAADNLFWLGRYAERAEETARLLRGVLTRLTGDQAPTIAETALARLLAVLAWRGQISVPEAGEAALDATTNAAALEAEVDALLYDRDRVGSLAAILGDLRDTAMLARERLSVDVWQAVNRLHRSRMLTSTGRLDPAEGLRYLNNILRALAAFSGMESENMLRWSAWRMIGLGRRIERAINTATQLHTLLAEGDPEADGRLTLLLELADSFMVYRGRYLTTPRLSPVLDLVLCDPDNPRALAFQVEAIADHVAHLPRGAREPGPTPLDRAVVTLKADLALADVRRLAHEDADGARAELADLLSRVSGTLRQISDLIAQTYFTHADGTGPTAHEGAR